MTQTRITTPLFCVLMLAAGCTDGTGVQRGPLDTAGKADALGTCTADTCGGQSDDGPCWCDDLCEGYGDCCANKEAVCDAPPQECGGFLGLLCPTGQMCTDDPGDDCDPDNGGADCGGVCVEQCGGFGGFPCDAGYQCIDYPEDNCDPANGGDDCAGMCVPECAEVVCLLACPFGFKTNAWGCEICECADAPTEATCAGSCGGQSNNGSCWCDSACSQYGDCCDDYAQICS